MDKIIYHGSDHIIEQPEFGYGKPYNDYGIGFYCTENPNMAKEWGVGIDHNGYANQYQINCDGLSILDLHASEYTLLHWLTILLENREFDTSTPLAAESERISDSKNFIWITKAMTLSLAIVQMTVIFLLLLIYKWCYSIAVAYHVPWKIREAICFKKQTLL